jgi:hypothetical protein
MSFFSRHKQADEKATRRTFFVPSSEAGRLRFSQATVDRIARERAARAAERGPHTPAPQH